MNDSAKLDPPAPAKGDAIHAVLRAGVGSLPVIGAGATELFTWFIKAPIEQRRDEWMREVGEVLHDLQEKSTLDLQQLQQDPAFIDIVMQATHVAMRNGQATKRTALRNAVKNTALTKSPDESLHQMFVRCVDTFTEWHLKILEFANDPPGWYRRHGRRPPAMAIMGSPAQVLTAAFPELESKRSFYDLVWRELATAGFLTTDSLHVGMTPNGAMQARTSELGRQFIAFISDAEASS